MKVPFLDLKIQYESIKHEIGPALQKVLETTAFSGGPMVSEFEQNFAHYCQVKHALGVSNGTEAIWIVLKCMDIGYGDEVITVPNTFIATVEAISLAGATPVFIDVDDQTYTMNPALIESAITEKTKAIIPVHLYGQMADMDPIMEVARRHNLKVIEDAAQAQGAKYKGKPAGSLGHAGCFSFYPGKNLGAYGEAGAITTSDDELAQRMDMFRNHGQSKKYYHDIIGWNGRMEGFQGAVLDVKLRHLESWTEGRRRNAELYQECLGDVKEIRLPVQRQGSRHVYHIYAAHTQNRDAVLAAMGEKGIGCGIHYPIPVHLQKAYSHMNLQKGAFPVAEQNAAEEISLPMFAELTEEQIRYTCEQLRQFF
ncbi:MAG: DegT/DnrJ/EryC1/StrS family aminotransferase [bacterium]|jgi:dTDP-4-amino-4,6-dideoxygalactose transaminase